MPKAYFVFIKHNHGYLTNIKSSSMPSYPLNYLANIIGNLHYSTKNRLKSEPIPRYCGVGFWRIRATEAAEMMVSRG